MPLKKPVLKKRAEVAPAIPLPPAGRQTYTYEVPPDTPLVKYQSVIVPFGKRTVPGIFMGFSAARSRSFPLKRLTPKPVPPLKASQVEFARWIAAASHGGLGYTLRLFTSSASRHARLSSPPPPATKLSLAPPAKPLALVHPDLNRRASALLKYVRQYATRSSTAIIVVPEVWLAKRLYSLMSKSSSRKVAAYHSELSSPEQQAIWYQAYAGELNLIIGTQKTLFLPFQTLSLVIIEEEFITTHKLWDQYPRLDNRYGAEQLARLHAAPLIYSSSFESLRLFHLQDTQQVKSIASHSLSYRVDIISSAFEDQLRRRPLPHKFISSLKRWHKNNDKILILANRRQSEPFLFCRPCIQAVPCPECGKILPKLPAVCSDCLTKHPDLACPKCGNKRLSYRSRPLANVSSILQKNGFSTTQINAFTTKKPDHLLKQVTRHNIIISTTAIFSALPELEFDRLIWLFPELDLTFPDYRCLEWAVYTLARLALRNGKPRRALSIVTRRPDLVHPLVGRPLSQIWQRLLSERRRHSYPPLTDLVKLTVTKPGPAAVQKSAHALRSALDQKIASTPPTQKINIRGPFPPAFLKAGEQPTLHLLLSGSLDELIPLYQDQKFATADLAPRRIL